MSSMTNPLVHLIRMPDEEEVCFTGNEKVKPSSLLSFCEGSETLSSLSTKSFSDDAIKSKSSCARENKMKRKMSVFEVLILKSLQVNVKNSSKKAQTRPPH